MYNIIKDSSERRSDSSVSISENSSGRGKHKTTSGCNLRLEWRTLVRPTGFAGSVLSEKSSFLTNSPVLVFISSEPTSMDAGRPLLTQDKNRPELPCSSKLSIRVCRCCGEPLSVRFYADVSRTCSSKHPLPILNNKGHENLAQDGMIMIQRMSTD